MTLLMTHAEFLQDVRSANAFLAAVGFTLIITEVHDLWPIIPAARRLRYISLCMFAFAVFYGSLETAYWPEHNIRVAWTMLACFSLVIAGVSGNMESRRYRRKHIDDESEYP